MTNHLHAELESLIQDYYGNLLQANERTTFYVNSAVFTEIGQRIIEFVGEGPLLVNIEDKNEEYRTYIATTDELRAIISEIPISPVEIQLLINKSVIAISSYKDDTTQNSLEISIRLYGVSMDHLGKYH